MVDRWHRRKPMNACQSVEIHKAAYNLTTRVATASFLCPKEARSAVKRTCELTSKDAADAQHKLFSLKTKSTIIKLSALNFLFIPFQTSAILI